MSLKGKNQAFIDGQNLSYSTSNSKRPWKVDLKKFRIYLEEMNVKGNLFLFLEMVIIGEW